MIELTSQNNDFFLILPGFLNISRNEILIDIYEKYPDITMKNCLIHSFYGNFPSCIWNGGRLCLGERYKMKKIKKIKDFHNKHDIAIALTMTNLLLEEKHISDKYSNKIMKIFHDGYNEVLVSSPILEGYIRKKYPKYKINKSITSKENPIKKIDMYNLSLIPSYTSNNEAYIKNIPLEYRKNIEILCNDPCVTKCKYKYVHYEELSNLQFGKNYYKTENNYGKCKINKYKSFNSILSQRNEKLFLPQEKIQYMVDTYGIKYFKINGREKYAYHGYDNIVHFCIKKEYQNDILCYMLERMILEFKDEVIYQIRKYGYFLNEDEREWLVRNGVVKL